LPEAVCESSILNAEIILPENPSDSSNFIAESAVHEDIGSNNDRTLNANNQQEDVRIVKFANSNMLFKDTNKACVQYSVCCNIYDNNRGCSKCSTKSLIPPSDLSQAYIWAYNINACPINVHRFKTFLKGYDVFSYNQVVDIVSNGVHIPSLKKVGGNTPIPINQKSTVEFEPLVNQMIMIELKCGRVAGPFLRAPPGLIISPLGAVPKKELGKIRIIHNLSHPLNDSVNSSIPREDCAVDYELIDVCCSIVYSIGKDCEMSKGDLSQAFRLLRVRLSDLKFLGFSWKGLIYFDKMMPMGAAISCAQFEKFSCAIQWILKNKFAVKFMSHILDDFLFFGHPGSGECRAGLQAFLLLAESLGLEVKEKKTVWPSSKVEMHGILFDSHKMTLSLPPDKVEKAKVLLNNMFKKKKVLLVEIQQLHGFLNFACRAVAPGRTFLRRISDLMKGVPSKRHFVRFNKEARKDLQAWSYFLDHFNSTPILPPTKWIASVKWKLFSDACGSSFASVFGHKWIFGS
ncbi:MAG: hypothetical protein GY705_25915, partial [Bacteroidetes bacterium]|nr:hypothetical protein [Bacteroidota bacterium]